MKDAADHGYEAQLNCIWLVVTVHCHGGSAVWCPGQQRGRIRRRNGRGSGGHDGGRTAHSRRQLPLKDVSELLGEAVTFEALGLVYHSPYTCTALVRGAVQTIKQEKQFGKICQTNATYHVNFGQVWHQVVATSEFSRRTSALPLLQSHTLTVYQNWIYNDKAFTGWMHTK